jgi:cellulose synthase/poly-beta-1,6-N-acetylglucosamine synthase-like glycosyltransferase
VAEPADWFWLGIVHFFYGWYTFLAIGVAGVWAVAATFARTEPEEADKRRYPMVSFVVPAYDEEKNVRLRNQPFQECQEVWRVV